MAPQRLFQMTADPGDDRYVGLLTAILDRQNDTLDRVGSLEDRLSDHMGKEEAELAAIAAAFPGGDMDGHRRYHASIIEWRELRNRLVREALVQAAKVGGVAAFGWLLYAIWTAIKIELTK